METLGFLLGIGCLVLLVWAIALLGNTIFSRKHRRRMRSHEQPPTNILEFRERETSAPNLPVQPISPRRVITTEQPLAETRGGYINPQHIRDFCQIIQREEAAGGFFVHTGRTGELSKELLREYRISLLSGQRLVDFVLGQRLKVVG